MIKHTLIFVLLSWLSNISFAQQQQAEKDIEQVIESLFQGMKNKNQQMLESAFHHEAIMHTVAVSPDGTKLGANSVKDFINRIAVTPAETVLDERIQSYHIKVDGDMASAWTPYKFYVNEGYSHCGVNSFQFIRIDGQWKITYVIDTRRKDSCD